MLAQALTTACGSPPSAAAPEQTDVVARAVGTNVALGKTMSTSGYTQVYGPGNANDGNATTYWEGTANAYPNTLTVTLGSNFDITQVVVQLNPDSVWATRTQNITVLGHNASTSTFSTLVAAANYTFNPASGNQITIPVTSTVSEVRLQFNSNTGSTGGQVAEFQVIGTASAGTATYALTVNGGTGGGSYAAGSVVNISANAAPSGQVFSSWSGGNAASFGNTSSASTTYTMGSAAASITANYTSAGTTGNKYEAESATLSGGAATTTNHANYAARASWRATGPWAPRPSSPSPRRARAGTTWACATATASRTPTSPSTSTAAGWCRASCPRPTATGTPGPTRRRRPTSTRAATRWPTSTTRVTAPTSTWTTSPWPPPACPSRT